MFLYSAPYFNESEDLFGVNELKSPFCMSVNTEVLEKFDKFRLRKISKKKIIFRSYRYPACIVMFFKRCKTNHCALAFIITKAFLLTTYRT